MMNETHEQYLRPTSIIDSDNTAIIEYAREATTDVGGDPIDIAIKLNRTVRDGIWYDIYSPFFLPEHYQASKVLARGRGYCVSKASLLCALGRTCGIPSRVGFADVKNHLATRQLIELMGTNIFVYHGFTEFFLGGKWVRATPAFNKELCVKHSVEPLEFNGHEDSVFQQYNQEKKQFMEYVAWHGAYADIPVDEIVAAWKRTYGADRVESWMELFGNSAQGTKRDFFTEDVVKP